MPVYRYNGDIYDIPDEKVSAFEKQYPDATISYSNGGDIYDIPISKKSAFLQQFPNATLYTEQSSVPSQPKAGQMGQVEQSKPAISEEQRQQNIAEGQAMFNAYRNSRKPAVSVMPEEYRAQQDAEKKKQEEVAKAVELDTLKETAKEDTAFIAEYDRRWKKYQDDTNSELSGPEVDAEKKWLDENNKRYREAKNNVSRIEGLQNLATKEEDINRISGKKAEIQSKYPAMFNPGGQRPDPSKRIDPNDPDLKMYKSANEIYSMAEQTYKQGSKVDPGYEGNWLEQSWTAAKQFVEGGANNFDMGSLTFGLSEGAALVQARRVGDKSNEIVNKTIKDMGYTDSSVNELIKTIDEDGQKLNDLGQELSAQAAELEAMRSTIEDMEKSGESNSKISSYTKQYNQKVKEYNARVKNELDPLMKSYKESSDKYDSLMSAVDSAVDNGLSDGEKALLDALEEFTEAKVKRANDVSVASAAGAGAEQSAEFMLDFILTGGIAKAGTKAATKLTTRRLMKKLGSEAVVAARPSLGAQFLTDIGVAAARTTAMFPRNLSAYGDQLTQMTGGKDQMGRYNFDRTHLNAALNTALTQYIEYWTEGFGQYFGAAEKAAFRNVTKAAPRVAIGKTLKNYRGSIGAFLDNGRFDGMFNEMLEEVAGSALNATAGWLSKDRVGDSQALKDFASGEQLATLFFSFLPMSAISAGTNLRAYNRMKARYDAGVNALNPFLESGAISREELEGLVSDIENKTPEEIKDKIIEISDKARKANGGYLPKDFAQNLMGYVDGTFSMSLNSDKWDDSQEKMSVVNSYTSQYDNPDERNAWDLAQIESETRDAAIKAGFDENILDLDAYAIARHAQAIQEETPEQAQVLMNYANAKAANSGLKDGYDKETAEYNKTMTDAIEQKCDINGNIIQATLPDGAQVFITSKDARVGADGKLTTPTGADGLVSYISPTGEEQQAKASTFTGATATDTQIFLIEKEEDFKQTRDLLFQKAQNTISPFGMSRALNQHVGQSVYVTGNGAYEPVTVVRMTNDGQNVVISGDKEALKGIATAVGINSPGGTNLELPVQSLYPLLATNDDGSLATDAPEVAPEEAPVADTESKPVPQNLKDLEGQELVINIDGKPTEILVDTVYDGGVGYLTKDENGEYTLLEPTMPFDEFQQAMGMEVAPAEEVAPAVEPEPEPEPAPVVESNGIPVDEKSGEPIYDADGVTPEQAYDDIYGKLSEKNADMYVLEQAKDADFALAAAEKLVTEGDKEKAEIDAWDKKPGEGLNAFLKRQADAKAKVDENIGEARAALPELQRKAAFWGELREVAEENIKAREKEAARQALIDKYGVDTSQFDLTPQAPQEAVAAYLGNSENLIDLEDAKKETLGKSKTGRVPAELFRHLGNGGILTANGGKMIADVANDIVGEYEDTMAIEQDQVRDLIIDYLTRHTKTEMRDLIFNNRLDAAIAERDAVETPAEELEQQNGTSSEEAIPAEEAVEQAPEGTEVPEVEEPESAHAEPETETAAEEDLPEGETENEGGVTVGNITYIVGNLKPADMVELWNKKDDTKDEDKGKSGRVQIIEAIYDANPEINSYTNEGQQLLAIEKVLRLAQEYPDLAISKIILSKSGEIGQAGVTETAPVNEPTASESEEKPVSSQKEGTTIAPGTQAVIDLSQPLGLTPVVIRSIEDIPESEARARAVAQANGLDSIRAWVNAATGQVFVVDGNVSEAEAPAIVQHEVVAHIGLPQLIGEEDYNALCDAVWDGMGEEDSMLFGLYALGSTAPSTATTYEAKVAWAKGVFEQFSQEDYDKINSPAVSRKAAAEYMASLAEKEDLSADDKNVWQRIKDAIRTFLTRVKIGIGSEITNEDIRNLIRASREALAIGAQTEAQRNEIIFTIPESALSQGDKDRMLSIMEQAGVTGDEMRDARRYLSGENTGLIVRASYLQAKQKALEYVRSRSGNLQPNSSAENGAHLDEQTSGNQRPESGVESRGQSVGMDTEGSEETVPAGEDVAPAGGDLFAGTDGVQGDIEVSGNGSRESMDNAANGVNAGGSRGTRGNGQKSESGRTRGQKGSGNAEGNTGGKTGSRPDINSATSEIDSILGELDSTSFALRGAPSAGKLNAEDRKEGAISLEGKSPEQISIIARLGKALAKAGYALIQDGVRAFNLWSAQMKARFGQKLKDNKVLQLTDEQVDSYIAEIWETDLEIEGRVMRVREWADEIGREALRDVMKLTEAEKRKLQKAADKVVPVFNDMANIREMLPFLLPEQQEDVMKAETQFFDPSHQDKEHGYGKGYLFTNATGTGKTFTGAGIIKRFVKSGKGRVLIITPTQNKVSDWISEGERIDLNINALTDTKDVGEGVVCTTYANFRENEAIMDVDFDLIVYDESHNITKSLRGTETEALKTHFQLANKDEEYAMERLTTYAPFFRELHGWERQVDENRAKINELVERNNEDGVSAERNAEISRLERETNELQRKINEAQPLIPAEKEKLKPRAKEAAEKTKVVFLSASAFATHASLRYAEGFIFSFPDLERETSSTTDRSTKDQMKLTQFLAKQFPHGYKKKNATTAKQQITDADKLEEEEVAFTEYLFSGLQTASGRMLSTEHDYFRGFPTLPLAMADRVNRAANAILTDRALAPLKEAFEKTFYDYNYGNALLETMKSTLIIPYIKQFLANGKKVVIFHSRLTSKEPLMPPFQRILELAATLAANDANSNTTALVNAQEVFTREFADVLQWEQKLNYQLPREQIVAAFGKDNVLLYSGQETNKVKEENVKKFQDDNSGKNIIVVQVQSGSEGISLHDKTGKYQRVLVNLSLPRSPILAIQGEGRTLRIGSKSNAIFWYPLVGLDFETWLFANVFAGRAGTQENLSMGPMARGLRDSFMNGVLEHSGVVDINEDTGGKAYDTKKDAGEATFEKAVEYYHEAQTEPVDGEDQKDGMPTPEPLGFKMVQWAGLQDGESVLEPSAGRGAIARFVPKGNKLKGMDIVGGLVSRLMLKLSGGGRSFDVMDFMEYDIHNKHDVVLMNPPSGEVGTDTAYLHLSKAFKHLVEGGRIVAVVPADMDVRGMDDSAVLTGEVMLPTVVTGQRGPMKVMIIDKVSRKGAREKMNDFIRYDLAEATSVDEFFARLRDIEMPGRKIDATARIEKAINGLKAALKVPGKKGILAEDNFEPWVPEVRVHHKKEYNLRAQEEMGITGMDDDAIVEFDVRYVPRRNSGSYRLRGNGRYGHSVTPDKALRAEIIYVKNEIDSLRRREERGGLKNADEKVLGYYEKVFDALIKIAGVTEEDVESRWFQFGELTPEEQALRDNVYSSSDEEIDALREEIDESIWRSDTREERLKLVRMKNIASAAKADLDDGTVTRKKKESGWKALGTLNDAEKQLRDRLKDMPLMKIKAMQQVFDNQLLDMPDKDSNEYRDIQRMSKVAESVYTDKYNEINNVIGKYGYAIKRQGSVDGLAQMFKDFSKDDYNSALFERLLPVVSRFGTKVLFTDTYSDATLGSYNPHDNQLLMNANAVMDKADAAVTIIHELIHDATTYAQYGRERGRIDADSSLYKAAQRTNRLWQALLLAPTRPSWDYPLSNDRELLAGITDAGFRDWLQGITIYVDNAENPTRYSMFNAPTTSVKSDALTELAKNVESYFAAASPYEHSHIDVPIDRRAVHQHGVPSEGVFDEEETDNTLFREETDADVLERLDNEPTVKAYRAMQFVPDPNGDWEFDLGDGRGMQKGFLYPPMSAQVDGKWREPIRRDKWERSIEQPEKVDRKGRFTLNKGNGKSLKAAYNPYFHSSDTMLNDQFAEAQTRPNLVVVEVDVPAREVAENNMAPYWAEKAKNPVGKHEWKAGPIQGQLTGTRSVYLSRWDKPSRIVPISEVADNVAKMVQGQITEMPSNVVWPQLRAELEKRGVPFVETDNQGKFVDGERKGQYYSSFYKGDKKAKKVSADSKARIVEAERLSTIKTLDRMSEELGITINKVPRTAMPIGHETAKGYYNPYTGEMTICMDNVTDERDAVATVLHETVGHHGLRKLFGPEFNNAMIRIYASLDAKGRAWVNAYMERHNLKPGDEGIIRGMEEYMAHLAESGDFKQSAWDKIKEIFGRIIDKLFGTDGFTFTDNELNYILRASYEHLKNPQWLNTPEGKAMDTLMKRALGINETDPNRPTDPEGPGAGLLYRDGDTGVANVDYDAAMELAGTAALTENQNADLPVKIGMDAMMAEYKKKYGKDYKLREDEDYLTRHNLASSRSETEAHNFELFHFTPLLEQVRAIQSILLGGKKGSKQERQDAYERILDYMYAVSGLERNRYKNAEIEAAKQDALNGVTDPAVVAQITKRFDDMKKDWSGLTSLMGLDSTQWQLAETRAQAMVDAFRSVVGDDALNELWDRVRSCTDYSLNHAFKSGMLTRDEYEKLHGTPTQPRMWNYYLPLRGFDENTAEEVYSYANFANPSTNNVVVKKMNGRWTQADNPLANILNIAETEIVQGNDNWAKQALLKFIQGIGDNTLLQGAEPWYVKNPATGKWSLAEPNPGETLRAFEERMKAYRALPTPMAKKGRKGLKLDNIMANKAHRSEHAIRLKVNGQDKMIWVNGNPALARAVSGIGRAQNLQWLRRASRALSNLFTTYSLDFTAKNLIRDTIYSRVALLVKEDRAYRNKFRKNWWRNLGYGAFAYPMVSLAARWESGELQSKPVAERTEREQMFIDFMSDGGQTGYTIINSVNEIKKSLERSMRMAGAKSNTFPVLGHYAKAVKTLNEAFELLTRFTAYETSRDMGRTGQRAASDAKEISVNFNRRGAQSGEGIWGNIAAYLGATHYFYNAGVQGFDNFLKLYKKSPVKMSVATGALLLMGVLTPLINGLLAGAAGGGDGDDEDWYWNLPEWVRRNNIVLGTGSWYLAIPLPVEFRAIYGMGDIMGAAFCYEKTPHRTFGSLAGDMISTASGILPVNPIEGYTGNGNIGDAALRAVAPDAGMFFVDWATNRDYTGRPLWKENPFSETVPKSQGAYASTPKGIVAACQKLAEISGGNIDVAPGLIRDFLNNYGGGFFRAAEDASKIFTGVFDNDPERPFRWDNVPFFSGFTGHIDEDRSNSFASNALYEYKKNSEDVVKKLNAICNTDELTAAMVYGDNPLPEKYDSQVRMWKTLHPKDYELGKKYREGMNNEYVMKQYTTGDKMGQWYKSRELKRKGVNTLKKEWKALRDQWVEMPDKTQEEKDAKAAFSLQVQEAWHLYYNAEADLAELLLNYEYGK